jgi:Spy/CpxP family protein refolding chaperone
MRFTKRMALAAALVAGVVASASAQDRRPGQGRQPGGFGFGGGFGGPNVYMLVTTNKDLQSELKITDEQKAKLDEALKPIQDKQRELRPNFGQGGERPTREQMQERMEKVAKLNEEAKKTVEGALKPEQAKRLSQIAYQAMGINAFTNKDVEAALKLTDGQKEKIKGVMDELNKDRMELMRGGPRFQPGQPPSEEDQKKFAELRKKGEALTREAQDKITALLQDEQKTAWKELTGEKFDVSKLTPQFGQRRRDN